MLKPPFLLKALPIAVSVCLATPTLADPTMTAQTWSLNENTKSGSKLGQISAAGGAVTKQIQLDVGTQNISNWEVRDEAYEAVNFNSSFSNPPIVLTQIQSDGDYKVLYTADEYLQPGQKYTTDAYDLVFLPRQQNVTNTGFEAILETEFGIGGSSNITSIDLVEASEKLGWLAFSEASQGIWQNTSLPFEVALSSETVTDSNTSVSLTGPFDGKPQVKASIATSNGAGRTGVGISSLSRSEIKVFMDEITDGGHPAEAVSLFMMQGDNTLKDSSGNVIGETGQVTFNDTDREGASTINLQNTYVNPVVFVQPLDTDEYFQDTSFRFTEVASNSFTGYLQNENEHRAPAKWGEVDLHYFVFEAGTWNIGVQNYTYSMIAGNDSGAFAIDADTGEISVADSNQLDYESGVTQYVLTVQATDGTGVSGTTTVTVNINDVDDALNSISQAIDGLAAEDWTGWQTAAAGDVNGDGFDDVIVGAPKDDTNGADAGAAYVLFGNSAGTLSSLSEVASGVGGFVIYGETAGDEVGRAVGGGADVNGDGLDDIAVGAPYSNANGVESGKAYVIFGKTDTTAVQLTTIASDSGTGGFIITGTSAYDWAGGSFVFGDVNGDGLADVVVGEPLKMDNSINPSIGLDNNSNSYWAHVVYGKTDGTAIALEDLVSDSDERGFGLVTNSRKTNENWTWGAFAMSAGDFNSDGLADFVLNRDLYDSLPNRVIFGKTGGAAVSLGNSSINGAEGIFLNNEAGNYGLVSLTDINLLPSLQTSPVGDVNGDGIDDVALFLNDTECCNDIDQARAYIIFGGINPSDIELADVAAGIGGFVIHDDVSTQAAKIGSISGAGDVNGDGYDDVVIGDPGANSGNGSIYLVYGKANTDEVYLSTVISGYDGFYSEGNAGDRIGDWLSNAGDFNGDGIGDVLFAAPEADPSALNSAGRVYLMLGSGDALTQTGTTGADNITGSTGDKIATGQGDDTITTNGAAVIYAGPGDDTIIINSSNFTRIDGGHGDDTLVLDAAGEHLQLDIAAVKVRNIEAIDIRGTGANTLSFNKNLMGSLRIIIQGDADDTVSSTNQQWLDSGTTTTLNTVSYKIYKAVNAEMWLQDGVSLTSNTVPIINDQTFGVDEFTSGGTVFATVVADANDIGDSVSFELISGNESGFFSVDADTGELSLVDAVKSLDYESGANYSLGIEVIDLSGATASATMTINVTDLSTIRYSVPLDASGGGSLWGDAGSLMGILGPDITGGAELVWDMDEFDETPGGAPLIDTPALDITTKGTLTIGSSYNFQGGNVVANLPVTLDMEYPDEVQPGVSMRLNSSITLGDDASIDFNSTAFTLNIYANMKDYDIEVSSELAAFIGGTDSVSAQATGEYAEYQALNIESNAGTASGEKVNPLRFEASIDLPKWVDSELEFLQSWTEAGLSTVITGEKQACKLDHFPALPGSDEGSDLFYWYKYAAFESGIWVDADLHHDFSVQLLPVGVLTLEDGTEHVFLLDDPGEFNTITGLEATNIGGLTFTPEVSHDSNGDGIIDATLDIRLNPIFTNDTDLDASVFVPMTSGYVKYNIQQAVCPDETGDNAYAYPEDESLLYEVDSAGPLIDAEIKPLSVVDLVNEVSYSLSDIVYTEQIAFDLCDGTGTACAAIATTASNVALSGEAQVANNLTGTYTYGDINDNAESGTTYQWRLADDDVGTNATSIAGATNQTYSVAKTDSGRYLQFCVTPRSAVSLGEETCSAWYVASGESNTDLVAGFDKALMLNGSDEYAFISTGGNLNPASSSFTAETWFKVNASTGTNQHLVQQLDKNGKGRTWLGLKSSGELYTWLGGSNLQGTTLITEGHWHHAAVSYEQSSKTLALYLDGELIASDTRSVESSEGDFSLGVHKTLNKKYLNGALDETRIWGEARTQAQIQQYMHLGVAADESNLLLYYTYDNDTGTTVNDVTGNYAATLNHNITLIDSTDYALNFDGSSDQVQTGSYNGVLGSNARTSEAWIKTTDNNAGGVIAWGGWNANTVNKGERWAMGVNGSGVLQLVVYKGAMSGSTIINDGEWHHIAITFVDDGSPELQDALFYVDGQLDVINSSIYNADATIDTQKDGKKVKVGKDQNNNAFKGEIDEVRIWSTARSQAELQSTMYTRLNGDESNLQLYYTFEDGAATDQSSNGRDGNLTGTLPVNRGIAISTSGSGTVSGVLPLGRGVRVALEDEPSLGSVVLDTSTGTFTYTATDSSTVSTDSFSYYVLDSNGDYSDSNTVSITLEGLSVGGGTSGSSVSAGDLVNQLQTSQTLAASDCAPQDYLALDQTRLNRYSKMSYLAGLELQQNPFTGALEVKLDDVQFGLQPYDILPGGSNSLNITENTISVGADGEVLLTRPALLDPCALERLMGPFEIFDGGILRLNANENAYYIARPSWTAQSIEATENQLLLEPLTAELSVVKLHFNDNRGSWQQFLLPALADREAVENFLGDFLEDLGNGQLSTELPEGPYRFIPDYLVTQTDHASGVFSVEALGDTNGDGLLDFAVIYPDGRRQEVYGVQ